MIKYNTQPFINPIEIDISRLECSYNNIIRIIRTFEFRNIVLIAIGIPQGSNLNLIKEDDLDYYVEYTKTNNMDICMILPCYLLSQLLEFIIGLEPEIIMLFSNNEYKLNPQMLCYSPEEIIISKKSDICISVDFDREKVVILMDKYRYSLRNILKKLKTLKI